jgi:DNA-binding XRE family transcriptional regulator
LFLLHHDLRQKHHLKSKKSIQKALLVIEQLETNHLQLQISSWHALKEQLFGPPNQSIRAEIDAAALAFVLAQKLKKAREDCQLTQAQLAALVHKNRAFIAQLEGNADNMTFKTLYEMVTIGLGGRVVVDLKF